MNRYWTYAFIHLTAGFTLGIAFSTWLDSDNHGEPELGPTRIEWDGAWGVESFDGPESVSVGVSGIIVEPVGTITPLAAGQTVDEAVEQIIGLHNHVDADDDRR